MGKDEKQQKGNGGASPLTFQILIEFQPETQSLQVQGPMNQPLVFLGMLEMAKILEGLEEGMPIVGQ